jgi:hypothetical protein
MITVTTSSQTIKPKSIYAKQKTFEIGGDIFLTSTKYTREETGHSSSDHSQVDFIINGSAGLFVIDGLKLSVEPAIQITAYEDDTWTHLKLYFTPEYVFNTKSNIYPYLGGSVGYTSSAYSYSAGSSQNQSGLSWGGKAGLKINVLGNALLNAGFSFYRETYNYTPSYGDVKQHYDVFGFKLGFSVFFR